MGLIRQNKRYKLFNNFTRYTIYTHDSEKPLVGSYLVGTYIFNPRLFSITTRVVVRYQYTRTLSRLLFVTITCYISIVAIIIYIYSIPVRF